MNGEPTDGGGICARKRRWIPDADADRTRRDGGAQDCLRADDSPPKPHEPLDGAFQNLPSSGSLGSPQIPFPVRRMAPKLRRFTSRSLPIENVLLIVIMAVLMIGLVLRVRKRPH